MDDKEIPQPTISEIPQFLDRTEIEAKSEELKDKIKLPKFPGQNIAVEQCQEWVNLLTVDMLSILLIYVYRNWPYVVNQQVDATDPNNIEKIYGLEDGKVNWRLVDIRKWIKSTHGGGNYRLDILNDSGFAKNRRIGSCKINIPPTEAEPILNLRTLDVDHKDNRAYVTGLINKGLLDGRTKAVIDKTQTTPGEFTPIVTKLLDMVSGMNQQQVETVRKQVGAEGNTTKDLQTVMLAIMAQNDPSKMVNLLSGIVNAKNANQPVNDNSSLVALITGMMKMQSESSNMQMQLMLKMMELNKPIQQQSIANPSDPVEMFDKMLAVVERFKSVSNGNQSESEPKSGWDRVIDIAEKVGEPLATIIAAKMMTPGGGMGLGNPNTMPQQNAGYTPPSGNRQINPAKPYSAYDPQNNLTNQPVVPTVPSNVIPMPEPQNELVQGIMQFGGMIAGSMNSGQSGLDFAQWVVQGFGVQPILSVKKYPIEQVIQTMKNIPEFWNLVSSLGEEFVTKWIYDFSHSLDQNNENEEVEEDTNI